MVCFQLKVMRYQDELEAGRRSRKPEMSIVEQVDHYRRKQLRKVSPYPSISSRLMHCGLFADVPWFNMGSNCDHN